MAGKKLDFNKYAINGNEATIFLDKRSGEILECLVTLEQLEKLIKLDWHWSASWYGETYGYYATHTVYLGVGSSPKCKVYLMHRVLCGALPDEVIDHENHEGLDNRDFNLRRTDDLNNLKNRGRANKNNKSKYRNIALLKNGIYRVQLQIDKKNTNLGEFKYLKDAVAHAEAMRKLYYGDYSGVSI